jgi:perosamine synthetase
VTCGAAALEAALAAVRVGAGDEVVVPEDCCHAIPASVVRHAARPVFAALDKRLVPAAAELSAVVSSRTRAVVAVHHWGIPAPVADMRGTLPASVAIIEDCAQLWPAGDCVELGIGCHSDVVVTSLGPRKPLSMGWGGFVCADDTEVAEVLGIREPDRGRERRIPPAPFAVPDFPVTWLEGAVRAADRMLAERRRLVREARPVLEAHGAVPLGPNPVNAASWHRLPFLPPASWDVEAACERAAARGLVVQRPHPRRLWELPMFAGSSPPPVSGYSRLRGRLLALRPPCDPSGAAAIREWIEESPHWGG